MILIRLATGEDRCQRKADKLHHITVLQLFQDTR